MCRRLAGRKLSPRLAGEGVIVAKLAGERKPSFGHAEEVVAIVGACKGGEAITEAHGGGGRCRCSSLERVSHC